MALPHITDPSDPAYDAQPLLTVVAWTGNESDAQQTALTWTHVWNRIYMEYVKRLIDILVASVALTFILPVLLLVALAIRLDSPGPVLYRQKRIGRNGHTFTIYKFRTMMGSNNPGLRLLEAPDGTLRHKLRNDPRVTRVGRWLRSTSIDELPQLANILLGHMSLIGPRPELVDIVERYQPWQHRRHTVRPGLTGWWQVNGRSDRPMHENTELDLYYVDHISPGLDFKILVLTFLVVIRGCGAF